jgi:hypothetical protein
MKLSRSESHGIDAPETIGTKGDRVADDQAASRKPS